MDPVARRKMWSILDQAKEGRSIMLTTHSMEESEALCQRIGVLVGGRLRCLGSAQHLKSRFGRELWVEVNIAERSTSAMQQVRTHVCRAFPSAIEAETHGQRIQYRLP